MQTEKFFKKLDTTFETNRPVDLKELASLELIHLVIHRHIWNQWEPSLWCEVNYGVANYGRSTAYTITNTASRAINTDQWHVQAIGLPTDARNFGEVYIYPL